MKKIKFYLTNRVYLFLICCGIFLLANFFYTGQILPNTSTEGIWFYSGLFMVLFSVLFIEPFYSSPRNVITNAIPLLLVYLSIRDTFRSPSIWWISFCAICLLIIISITAISLSNKDESENSFNNRFSNKLKSIAVLIGQGKVIYSAVFLSILFLYKIELLDHIPDSYYFLLIVFWGALLLIDSKSIHNRFVAEKTKKVNDAIGEIFSVQSKDMFLVKLFEDKINIKKFDQVRFRYVMDDYEGQISQGFIFDTYHLNKEKWAKILRVKKIREDISDLEKNTVYKVKPDENNADDLRINSFVGVVIEDSKIGVIKFEYSQKENDLQEGDLLELKVDGKRIFYQVFGGETESEKLEHRDEYGYIKGEAVQLGIWNNQELSFEKFGWIPKISTPLFKADTKDIEVPDFSLPEYKLGVIPKTNLPSVINLNDAISHHIALLGVTGSGKSFIARELIKEMISDTKVIVIDFTGEWKEKLKSLKPIEIIDKSGLSIVEKSIAEKQNEASGRNSDKKKLLDLRNKIQKELFDRVENYIKSKENLSLFELPELSNTTFILEFTQFFIEGIFNYAKENPGQKICLVLEEAHTIIPETNFLGDLGDYGSSKALVSKMSQIALQGRKYGVGLVVIAQRTANVSKTVLTQCNSIICFQAFDETSFTFLGNYIGKELIQALPNLKNYHAIVTGKAIKSKIPMIVNLERELNEPVQ